MRPVPNTLKTDLTQGSTHFVDLRFLRVLLCLVVVEQDLLYLVLLSKPSIGNGRCFSEVQGSFHVSYSTSSSYRSQALLVRQHFGEAQLCPRACVSLCCTSIS